MATPTCASVMLSCSSKLSAYRLPIASMPRSILPNLAHIIRHVACSTSGAPVVKNMPPSVSFALFCSFRRRYSCRAMNKDIYPLPRPHEVESCEQETESDLPEEPNFTEKIQVDSPRQILESFDSEDDKEIQRKKKISHGNKGRVPWNKGWKHSEETRARIRHRTKEALKDPKVRKKMSEAPRALSNQTIAKIRTSLRKLWDKRLKWKRSREIFLHSWAESVAKAAKRGGPDQEELDWDSYDKLKRETALLQIHQAAEKSKAEEMARARAERAAQLKAEKMALVAQKRREQEENAIVRRKSIRKRNRKSKEEKEKLAESREVKLRERLTKIHKKKPTVNQVCDQLQRPWEKFDLDFAKGEQLQREISLADQIRSAKNSRAKELLDKL